MASAASIDVRHGPAWRVKLANFALSRGWLLVAAWLLDGTYMETSKGGRVSVRAG